MLNVGQQLKLPVEGSTATFNTITPDTYQPSGFNTKAETYVVAKGDTLTKIARRFNISVKTLKAANKKSSDKILVGEKLIVPVDGSSSPSSYSRGIPAASNTPINHSGVHVVRAGEYPATIARRYGITTAQLLAMNNITEHASNTVGPEIESRSEK